MIIINIIIIIIDIIMIIIINKISVHVTDLSSSSSFWSSSNSIPDIIDATFNKD